MIATTQQWLSVVFVVAFMVFYSSDVQAADKTVKGISLVSDSADNDIQFSMLLPEQVCQGVTFRNIRREIKQGLKVCIFSDCLEDGQTNCRANAAYKALSPASIDAAKMLSTQTLLGISGTISQCSGNGVTGCVTTPSYKSADLANLSAGNIKDGVTIAGQLGNYPSVSYPLTVSDGVADLDAATFDTKIKSAANFAWFDREGHRYTHAGDPDIDENNIVDGTTIFGVDGIVTAGPPPDAWDIRAGVTINGVSGKLLTNCRNLANTALWDQGLPMAVTVSSGVLTASGHTLVDNQVIRLSHTSTAPSSVNYITDYFVINSNQGAGTFQISATQGGAAINTNGGTAVYFYLLSEGTLNTWDTIDDSNNAGALLTQNPWGADNSCGGIDTKASSADDDKIWQDITSGTSGCTSSSDCRFKDKITGLEWTEAASSVMNWGQASAYCESLNTAKFDGVPVNGADKRWRLPTQKEAMSGSEHGIRSAASTDWIPLATMDANFFWSSSTMSSSGSHYYAHTVNLATGAMSSSRKGIDVGGVACVR